MTPVDLFGWLGALTATILGIPQAVRLVRTRDTSGVSLLAWQAILAINIAWTSHGIVLQQPAMIVPNALALAATVPVLVVLARSHGLDLLRVFLPGLLGAAAMIGVDLLVGSAAYGVVALVPALIANAGQGVALVRSPNQALWLAWAVLMPDQGTQITAVVTGLVAVFNLSWWLLRRAGLPAFFVVGQAEGSGA
jgi:uncharacterized protein with PQ loop repeat